MSLLVQKSPVMLKPVRLIPKDLFISVFNMICSFGNFAND